MFSERGSKPRNYDFSNSKYNTKVLDPKGVAVVIDAGHQCMTTRGVHKTEFTVTSSMKGIFKENPVTRNEFLSFINLPKKH